MENERSAFVRSSVNMSVLSVYRIRCRRHIAIS